MAQNLVLVSNNVLSTAPFFFGGSSVLVGVGTFGTALYTLQYLGPDGSTWINTPLTITAVGISASPVNLPTGRYQLVLTSGSGNSGVYVSIATVPININ